MADKSKTRTSSAKPSSVASRDAGEHRSSGGTERMGLEAQRRATAYRRARGLA